MKEIYDLMQERARLTVQIREIMNRNEDAVMNADDKSTMARLEAEYDALNERITREQKQLDRERAEGEVKDRTGEPKDETGKLFARAIQGDADAFTRYKNLTQTLGTDANAGYLTAPVEFVNRLIAGLGDNMFMRQICDVVGPIGQAQSLGYPTLVTDASDIDWTTEIVAAPEEAAIKFGRREFKPQRLAKLIKISKSLIRHAPDPEGTILDRILYKVETAQENAYLNGDGNNSPLGIFTANANGIATTRDITGSSTTTITADDILDTKYGVKGQYMRNASWVMHRDVCKILAKLKDTNGQYLWQPSVQLGQPDILAGAPVYMSEFAPNTLSAGKYVAVYGDFKTGYWICDADGLYIQILNEMYAVSNQVGYVVEYYGDGAPVCGEAFARLKLKAS